MKKAPSKFYGPWLLRGALLAQAILGGVPSLFAEESASAPSALGTGKDWLAYGDLRSYLEPCGCDPKTDLGGIRRMATLLRRERGLHPDALIFDMGNNLASPESRDRVKNPFMEEALAAFAPDARLFNVREWEVFGQGGKSQMNQSIVNRDNRDWVAWVLSNRASRPGKTPFPVKLPSVLGLPSATVMGFVSPALAPDAPLILADEGLLTAWASILKNQKLTDKRPRILLFAGDDQDLAFLARSKFFDEIISSNRAPMTKEPGKEESENPASLYRKIGGAWMVPLGGQGVLRGGKLRRGQAVSLDGLLSREAGGSGMAKAGVPFATKENMVTWLDRSFEVEGISDQIMSRYNRAVKDQFASGVQSRLAALKDTTFAGAEACATCHVKAYDIWQKSHHAKALGNLKAKGKDQDPECVSCHVLGFEVKGGFVSESDSPQFANVQCESCHGPAKAHVANPGIKPVLTGGGKTKEVCVSCHHLPHSSSFEFKKYWGKISHGK